MTGKIKHRPGALKQTNKAHKTGRHRSKGAINLAAKGTIVKVFAINCFSIYKQLKFLRLK